jgi:hypothetical protein
MATEQPGCSPKSLHQKRVDLDESEVMVLIASAVLAAVGLGMNTTGAYHPLYFRDNPAPGIVRLGILAAMVWIAYVLWQHADPSVTGPYVIFYLVMGYAVVKTFGQSGASWLGLRTRVDAAERRNVPAALVTAAFILSTGLIFGGSLWGEADPVGDDEGGWWIPAAFFLLGWICLVAAYQIFQMREGRTGAGHKGIGSGLPQRLHRERDLEDARAAGFFLLSAAAALTDAVAGDFWGWTHGLLTFGVLAALLLVHELFATFTHPETHGPSSGADSHADSGAQDARGGVAEGRTLEAFVYVALALLLWGANRVLDSLYGGG